MIKNRFKNGFLVGLLLPLIAFPLFHYGDIWVVEGDIMNKLTGSSKAIWSGFKPSTIALFAVCINLIPTLIANKRRLDEFIRGIMIPTVIFSFIWFFYFWKQIM